MAGFTYNPFTYAAYTPGKYEKSKEVLEAEKKKADAEKLLAGLGDFTESDATKGILQKKTEAEKALANYGDFSWAKQGEYDKLLSDYQNRKDFSYDFNADALYQQYKDKYIQQGKMAMQDTMGQAAAMTGGYGNSYAATAGNQAYQAQLQNLNDVIPQLYQMAYDRYNQKGQDMLNMIGLMGNERNFDYGVWGDKYNQLATDRSYYGSEYDSSWARDFSTYGDKYNRLAADRGYYAGEADNAFNRDYGVWSDSETRRWNQYDSDRNLAHGEHTTSENYRYQTGRDAVADEQWAKNYAIAQEELALKKNNVSDNPQPQPIVDPAKMEKETEGFRSKLSPESAHDAIQRQMYGPYTAYVAVQIAKDNTLSDDAKMYLITKYGITDSDIQYARDKGYDI